MSNSAVITTIADPAVVYAGHGGVGAAFWKRFVAPGHLVSETESFEYNRIPPRAVIGQHIHTRTEEIYFVISGSGEMITPDGREPIKAGDLVMTRIGGQHGVENTGTEDLEFLVIEVMPAAIAELLPPKISVLEKTT